MKKFLVSLGIFFAGFSSVEALPQINFSISPSVGLENTEFVVDARDSRNSGGNKGGIDFRCQYDNQSAWTKWSPQLVLKFRGKNIGRQKIKCEIRDRETGQISRTFREYQIKKDFVRRMRIEASATDLTVGEPVFFSLIIPTLTGENPDTILARWDFNSDGVWDTKFSRKKVLSYAYDKPGQVTPTVEVKFPYGRTFVIRGLAPTRQDGQREYNFRENKLRISRRILQPPIVNISPGTSGFTEKTIFHLDASKSKIPRLGWLEWSIDGQQWQRFPRKKKIDISFKSAGKHEVRTRVCLGKKNLKCAQTTTSFDLKNDPLDFSLKILLQNRTNPVVSQVYVNGNIKHYVPVEVGDLVHLTAVRTSYGNLGQVLYRWDFNGDGQWDTDFSRNNSTETHFDHLGEWNIIVQAQSEDGVLVEANKKILVKINPKPTVYISQNPAKIFVGEKAFFIPKFSSDINAQVRFDMDNDGIWESNFRGLSAQYWTFETAGEKNIRVQIRDKGGNVTTINKKIVVYDLPKPQARVIVSRKYVFVNQSVVFDASESVGRKLRYFWDFDSTGIVDAVSEWEDNRPGPFKISRVFRTPGEKIISLKVIDEAGQGDQIFFSVFVQEKLKTLNNSNNTISSTSPGRNYQTGSITSRAGIKPTYFRTNQPTPGWFAFL